MRHIGVITYMQYNHENFNNTFDGNLHGILIKFFC